MITNNLRDDKRKFKRARVNFLAYYKINSPITIRIQMGDIELVALAADISEGGIAIMTGCRLPPVASISIKFHMMNDKAYNADHKSRTMTVQGEVRYNIPIKERKEYKVGTMFLDLSDDGRNFIHQFVSMNK